MNKMDLIKRILRNQTKDINKTTLARSICDTFPMYFTDVEATRKTISRLLNKKEELFRGNGSNVLVVGDLHAPFTHKDYLTFLKAQYKRFNCGKVVFIGDIVDNHAMSFHEVNADGYSAGEELIKAREILKGYYKAFPKAVVTIGNHGLLPFRKASANGISRHILKDPSEIWQSPKGWTWKDQVIIDNVRYVHGTAMGKANKLAPSTGMSTVLGHWHSLAYVEYHANFATRVFSMQVGCGIDYKSYAYEYGKAFKDKPMLSCGIVFKGTEAMVVPMKLNTQEQSNKRT